MPEFVYQGHWDKVKATAAKIKNVNDAAFG